MPDQAGIDHAFLTISEPSFILYRCSIGTYFFDVKFMTLDASTERARDILYSPSSLAVIPPPIEVCRLAFEALRDNVSRVVNGRTPRTNHFSWHIAMAKRQAVKFQSCFLRQSGV